MVVVVVFVVPFVVVVVFIVIIVVVVTVSVPGQRLHARFSVVFLLSPRGRYRSRIVVATIVVVVVPIRSSVLSC